MGGFVFRGIMSFEKFITNIAANNFKFWGIAVGGIVAVVALILGYALLVQAAAFAVVSLTAIVSQRFNFPKSISSRVDNGNGEEGGLANSNDSADINVDKSRKIKIGNTYWTV